MKHGEMKPRQRLASVAWLCGHECDEYRENARAYAQAWHADAGGYGVHRDDLRRYAHADDAHHEHVSVHAQALHGYAGARGVPRGVTIPHPP